jgi:nitroimidazol reductase NimA-like FMN-containing flavoprotein (pyridoxamine 5'-phosphate oxidase superfamily)
MCIFAHKKGCKKGMVGTPLSKEEIRELLVKEKTCWLATVTPEGRPHIIPINFGFFNGNVYIIFVSNKSKSVRNIKNNQNVCFGINIGEKPGKIKCVLISGKAELIDEIDALKQAHLKILPKYLTSKKDAEHFLQKLTASGAIKTRTLVIIKPLKITSWKL